MIGGPVPIDETCIDVDPRNDGDMWALLDMARLGGWERPQLPPTCTVISGRLDGGQHHRRTPRKHQTFSSPESM